MWGGYGVGRDRFAGSVWGSVKFTQQASALCTPALHLPAFWGWCQGITVTPVVSAVKAAEPKAS